MASLLRSLTRNRQHRFGSRSTAEEVTNGIDASSLTAIVTGGASGIGAETARILALRGAHVIIAARNSEAAEEMKRMICAEKPGAKIELLQLDLSSMASIRKFVEEFKSLNLPLNILINNAGVMQCPFQLTQNGIELQFATNHLGHFLLTDLLLDTMKETALKSKTEGRIVILSSSYHKYTYKEGIRFDKINSSEGYSPLHSYGQSKLANALHCFELARRLQEEHAPIIVNCVHPGYIFTNLQRHILLVACMLSPSYAFTHTSVCSTLDISFVKPLFYSNLMHIVQRYCSELRIIKKNLQKPTKCVECPLFIHYLKF